MNVTNLLNHIKIGFQDMLGNNLDNYDPLGTYISVECLFLVLLTTIVDNVLVQYKKIENGKFPDIEDKTFDKASLNFII